MHHSIRTAALRYYRHGFLPREIARLLDADLAEAREVIRRERLLRGRVRLNRETAKG